MAFSHASLSCCKATLKILGLYTLSALVVGSAGVRIRNRQNAFSIPRAKNGSQSSAMLGDGHSPQQASLQQRIPYEPTRSLPKQDSVVPKAYRTMAYRMSHALDNYSKHQWHAWRYANDTAYANETELPPNNSEPLAILMAIGGGIGAHGNKMPNSNLSSRVHWQDKGILVLNLMIYFVSLCLWASFTYRRAANNSPVTYFCQPGRVDGSMSGHSLQDFLGVFAQAPQTTLQVTGYERAAAQTDESIHWRGEKLRSVFAWSFDLSPWMVHDVVGGDVDNHQSTSVSSHDMRQLEHFLTHDSNDLAFVEIQKVVSWDGFDELATNIKQHIRQQGFTGVTSVWLNKTTTERVHKNRPWSNFLHARTTFLLSWLSIAGVVLYFLYMLLKSRPVPVKSRHKVNVSIDEYWHLIVGKLHIESLPVSQTGVSLQAGRATS